MLHLPEKIYLNIWTIKKCSIKIRYKATDKHTFSQRIRRLREFSKNILDNKIKKKVLKLCSKKYSFMDKFLYNRKYLKGRKQTAQKSITAFCIAHNFRPYVPATVKKKNIRSPFEKLNGFQYHDNWLQNMLIATSGNGYRNFQQKKT